MNTATILGVVAGIFTGLGGLATALWTRRQINATAESTSISTMKEVVMSVRDEMSRLQDANENLLLRLQELEHVNTQLRYRVAKLEAWIAKQGHDPAIVNGH